jgi:hypothetical protein
MRRHVRRNLVAVSESADRLKKRWRAAFATRLEKKKSRCSLRCCGFLTSGTLTADGFSDDGFTDGLASYFARNFLANDLPSDFLASDFARDFLTSNLLTNGLANGFLSSSLPNGFLSGRLLARYLTHCFLTRHLASRFADCFPHCTLRSGSGFLAGSFDCHYIWSHPFSGRKRPGLLPTLYSITFADASFSR